MTIAASAVGRWVQLAGLVGSIAALGLTVIFGQGYAIFDGTAAAIAIGLDATAIWAAPRTSSIPLSIVKLVVSFAPVLVVMTQVVGTPPLVDPRTGLFVLLWSCLPSIAGALIRRTAR